MYRPFFKVVGVGYQMHKIYSTLLGYMCGSAHRIHYYVVNRTTVYSEHMH